MSITQDEFTAHHPAVAWAAVAGVQPLVFVARVDDEPVAILELRPSKTFELTTCSGVNLGDFAHIDDAHRALQIWIDSNVGNP